MIHNYASRPVGLSNLTLIVSYDTYLRLLACRIFYLQKSSLIIHNYACRRVGYFYLTKIISYDILLRLAPAALARPRSQHCAAPRQHQPLLPRQCSQPVPRPPTPHIKRQELAALAALSIISSLYLWHCFWVKLSQQHY